MRNSRQSSAEAQFERVALADLVPYARNARTHSDAQVGQIAASIREFGFISPIIIDADNGIIAGHGRLAAAQKLKLKDVPCLRVEHLTETQKRAYILADNKLALNAGWDTELLKVEIATLQEENFDALLTGFSDEEMKELLGETEEPDPGNGPSGNGSLSDRFGIPPFSVLNAREGWWQDRKRKWLAIGIKSELGRGNNTLDMSATMAGITDPEERERWNSARRIAPPR